MDHATQVELTRRVIGFVDRNTTELADAVYLNPVSTYTSPQHAERERERLFRGHPLFFGLSFGLAFAGAIMLAALAVGFTALADSSDVLTAEQQQQVSAVLEDDAELMSNTGLEALLVEETPEVSAEMIRINTEARHLALQIALLIPILAGAAGILNGFRMRRLPDPVAAGSGDTILG